MLILVILQSQNIGIFPEKNAKICIYSRICTKIGWKLSELIVAVRANAQTNVNFRFFYIFRS